MPAKNLQRVAEGGTYCHVYNRGIENRNIFADDVDYQVFLGYLEDYLTAPKAPESTKKEFIVNGRTFTGVPHQPKNYFNQVELLAYSLSPDHFHLLIHQRTQKSLQALIRSLCTRYSMYFNKKYNHTGSLFDGPYKSVVIKDEQSLLLLTRYLHKEGGYSSYPEFSGQKHTSWVKTNVVLSLKNISGNYKDFVEKYTPDKHELELLDEITIEKADKHLERRDLKKVELQPWSRIPELLVTSAIFVLLLGIGIRNVHNYSAASATLGEHTTSVIASTSPYSPSPITTPPPTTIPEPKTILIITNTKDPVDIRENPSIKSNKIGEAKAGEKFEFISEDSGFYQVALPEGTYGFIFSQYIEKEKTINND
ncbi:MAG: SH3 domain-containing protein [Candidatus Curtissbacteria bacterium]|nr:SH3 domain-containing protein [Candidatus Curtissbacteria bacterium]